MLHINLNRNQDESLSEQIYQALKEFIFSGDLKADEKLPSTRGLSEFLSVSRNVVMEAYEQLWAEGYLYSKEGSGTYVSDGIFFERKEISSSDEKKEPRDLLYPQKQVSFRTGVPDLNTIPIKKWGQLYKSVTQTLDSASLDYQNSFGMHALRNQLSIYLKRVRGVNSRPENILIVNGAAQAFSLLSRMVGKDEEVLVENPISQGIVYTLSSLGVRMKTIPIDENGIMTAALPEKPPKLIFTTPSHQFPTGVVLSIKRRIELIEYARKHDCLIVEDDYDSEFRFEGNPIQSLQNLDPDRVIYVGTFSKILSPALRMGYLVLPGCLVAEMKNEKYVTDIHSPVLEQLTLAKFIEEGYLTQHIRKMKGIYLKRRNYLEICLKESFGDDVTVTGTRSGMHLVAAFESVLFDAELRKALDEKQIFVTTLGDYFLHDDENPVQAKKAGDHALVLGYGNTNLKAIEEGVTGIAQVVSIFKQKTVLKSW
ncbi:aminotransferase class I/II-fold pyridoxal phosphate-dependent enzyme [Acetobacterium paludosum]|uniref:Aminotransferase class I/II-fold pyridoxal phosphate-dependent enzyme n=1 Tax=Acetobacterium paludosum TaxID=52693 RepID=A0A923KQB2_9FIRM|nr:PLP-dependent aminotransferase family protein [Acetobacterium paludosum]MBC3888964.1 aminotransferase class I/II-fold pyridoxal phosphate-dependent enzyme [Acetobacterium paludosum]